MTASTVLAVWILLSGPQAAVETLTGTVHDPRGSAIGGALVIARTPDARELDTRTGTDGSFMLDVAAGDVTLVVRAAGFAEYRQLVRAAERAGEVHIVLSLASFATDVTVTAGRIEQRLSDIPAAVAIVDRTTIEHSPAMMTDDVLRQAPAFSLFRRSSSVAAHPTAQGVSLRGIGPSGVSRTLVLLDGVPMNDPFGGWVSWSRVPTGSIRRIEIVEGPSASLFGSSALGGAINVITAAPAVSSLDITARYAERGTPRLDTSGALRRGRAALSGDAAFFHTDGYPVVRVEERGAVDTKVSLEFANVSGTLRYDVNDRAALYARAGYLDESRDNGKRSTIDGTAESNDTEWFSGSGGAALHPRAGGELRIAASVDRVRFRSNFLAVPAAVPARSVGRMTLNQLVPSTGASASAQWSQAFHRGQLFTAGGDWRLVEGESREDALDAQSGARVVLRRVSGGTQNTAGLFVQDVITLPRGSLTLALRHDRWINRDGHNLETDASGVPTSGNRPRLEERDDNLTSPRAALLVRATDWASVWGSVGFGFRAPTLNELYRQFRVGSITTLANETLGAERLRAVEAGVRLSTGSRTLWRTTWSESTLDDAVSNVTINSTTQRRQNIGRTRIRAFEADVEWRPARYLAVKTAYLHNRSRVVEADENPLLVGLQLAQVPGHRASAQLQFTHPRGALSIAWLGTSRQYDDDLNVRAVPGRDAPGLPGYAVVDVLASTSVSSRLQLFAGAQNLFNRTFYVGTLPTTIGAPRLVSVGVRWQMHPRAH